MKKLGDLAIVLLLAAGLGVTWPSAAEGQLERLESGIRSSNDPSVVAVAAASRVYLGARADNDLGGVRVLNVSNGGPADRAGLKAQDLIVAAAGRKIGMLTELSAILNGLNPGDRLSLEVVRGIRPLRVEVVLGGAPLGPPGPPPAVGPGAGRTESIPPPPGDALLPPATSEGPSLVVPGSSPQPNPPNSPQAQIEQLRRRVDQLERRIEELERALAESRRK